MARRFTLRLGANTCRAVELTEGQSLSITHACLVTDIKTTRLVLKVTTCRSGHMLAQNGKDLPSNGHCIATLVPGRAAHASLDLTFFATDSQVLFYVEGGSAGSHVELMGVLDNNRGQRHATAVSAVTTGVRASRAADSGLESAPMNRDDESDESSVFESEEGSRKNKEYKEQCEGEEDDEEEGGSGSEEETCEPGFEIFEVMLPKGAQAGDVVHVDAPNGRTISITVPPGMRGGITVPVKLPVLEEGDGAEEDSNELNELDQLDGYGLRVMNIYLKYKPEKLEKPGFLTDLMDKVQGKEEKLIEKLVRMYGPEESDDDDNMDFSELDEPDEHDVHRMSSISKKEARRVDGRTSDNIHSSPKGNSRLPCDDSALGNTHAICHESSSSEVSSHPEPQHSESQAQEHGEKPKKKKNRRSNKKKSQDPEEEEEEPVEPCAEVGKMVQLRSGVQYVTMEGDVENGGAVDPDATPLRKGNVATFKYKGILAESGKKFGGGSLTILAGCGYVVPGLDEGIRGMREREKRRVFVPSIRGYGGTGSGTDIPPNADLIFDVELKRVGSRRSEKMQRERELRQKGMQRKSGAVTGGKRKEVLDDQLHASGIKKKKLGRRAKKRMRVREQKRKDRKAGKVQAKKEREKKRLRPLSGREREQAREERRQQRLAEESAAASAASDALASDFALKMVNGRVVGGE